MPMNDAEREVAVFLEQMGVPFVRYEHPAVATVAEAEKYWGNLRGAHCKNLFLRNNKGNRHYLVVAEASRRVDLKALTRVLGEDRLSFASAERLKKYLGLEAGSVSPFGLIHDAG
jgi:Ala-tRNA(Pro) deacylase